MSHNNPSPRWWVEDSNHRWNTVLGLDPLEGAQAGLAEIMRKAQETKQKAGDRPMSDLGRKALARRARFDAFEARPLAAAD